MHRGFTLIELLVVIVIVLIVSAVALPTVLPAMQHRQVSEAARILQAALVGARDSAIKNNRPSGIRLMPDAVFNGIGQALLPDGTTPNPYAGILDPTQPLAYDRVVPIAAAPDYSEGSVRLNQLAASLTWTTPPPSPPAGYALLLIESVVDPAATVAIPNSPTSWFWNVRVGDKIQINQSGVWYTVVGPLLIGAPGGNNELFVNFGAPGTTSPLKMAQGPATVYPEFLFLVNGQDDNSNGWIDEGWDGVDNNLAYELVNKLPQLTDEALPSSTPPQVEWEQEVYLGSLVSAPAAMQYPYTIRRRPAPTGNAREVLLPTNVVIDATTWATTQERSRLRVNPYNGYVDLMVNPTGTVIPNLIYSAPSIVGMSGSFVHFWLGERSDVYAPSGVAAPSLPIGLIQPQLLAAPYAQPQLQGEYRLLTLFTRTGQIVVNDNVLFDNPANPANNAGVYNSTYPFIPAQQGLRGGQ